MPCLISRNLWFFTAALVLAVAASPVAVADVHMVMNTNDSGPDSLRFCIEQAEPGDEIQFDPSLDGQPILLSSGELVVGKDLTITGRGPESTIIDGNSSSRVLHLSQTGTSVTVSGVKVMNGSTITIGGGIRVSGATLRLDDTAVTNNYANGGGGIAVWDLGTAVLRNTTVGGNTANGYGGGIVVSFGTLSIDSSVVMHNRASTGGGIANDGSTVLITNSTISHNDSRRYGGGIWSDGYWQDATVTLKDSTLSNNTLSPPGSHGRGAGINVEYSTLILINTTVSGNAAHRDRVAGGISGGSASTITLNNSVIANQVLGWDCRSTATTVWNSLGHNLHSDGTCAFEHPTDLIEPDAMLGPLQDNAGPTRTHVPLEGSPLIDAGWCETETDQRGVPRPIDGNLDNVWICDIGAVEYVPYCDGPDRPCDDGQVEIPGSLGEPIHFPPDSE